MKKVLSLLLSYAFLQAQTFALGGGPGGGLPIGSLVGTYSGVMIPDTQTNPSPVESSASIGLFSVGVPQAGLATGSAVVFVNGIAYLGDVSAVADPKYASLVGIVEATSSNQVTTRVPTVDANGNIVYQDVTSSIYAQGNLKTKIVAEGSPTAGTTSTAGLLRLQGTATLDLYTSLNTDASPDVINTVTFQVEGFKQSDSVGVAGNANGGNNNGGGNNGGGTGGGVVVP